MTLSGFARTSASVVVAVVVVGIGHAAAQTPRRMSAAVPCARPHENQSAHVAR